MIAQNLNIDYIDYFKIQLNLSTTILGLLIATSTFILQSGFSSFKYSRSMFLKYFICLSKILFVNLGYLIFLSITFLYFSINPHLAYVLHLIYAIIFTRYLLDFYNHKGYLQTIFSTKYNPYKNKLLKYFRYISNLGLFQLLIIAFLIFIVAIYPLFKSDNYIMLKNVAFESSIIVFCYSIVALILIIPQFFTFSEKEYQSVLKTENSNDENIPDIDYTVELQALYDFLIKNGHDELIDNKKIGDFSIRNHMRIGKYPEAFFVIYLTDVSGTVYDIRKKVEEYSFDFCNDLYNSKIDINSFVLSFMIRIDKELKDRNIFIRVKRTELDKLITPQMTSELFVKSIENKLIDELFRDL
jgi:hypothetical protein